MLTVPLLSTCNCCDHVLGQEDCIYTWNVDNNFHKEFKGAKVGGEYPCTPNATRRKNPKAKLENIAFVEPHLRESTTANLFNPPTIQVTTCCPWCICAHLLLRKKITVVLFASEAPSWVRVAVQFWACSCLWKTSLSAVLCWFFCNLAFSFCFLWHGFLWMKLKLEISFQGVHHSQHWSTLKVWWICVGVCVPFVVGDTRHTVLMKAPFI